MARRHHSYRAFEVKIDKKQESEQKFIQRIERIAEALYITVSEIGGVTNMPPALGKLVTISAYSQENIRKALEHYKRAN